jgi:hypothetical protein
LGGRAYRVMVLVNFMYHRHPFYGPASGLKPTTFELF